MTISHLPNKRILDFYYPGTIHEWALYGHTKWRIQTFG